MKKLNPIHMAFDLELEQPKTNPQTPDSLLYHQKIIQVGWVIYQLEPEFKVLEQKQRHVNIEVPLSKFIKQLTGISDYDIQNGTNLKSIYDELIFDQKTYNASRILNQWGSGDDTQFKKELRLSDWYFGRGARNIKHIYQLLAEANGLNPAGSLKTAMKRVRLTFEGRAHGAMVDAYNTAKMHDLLHRTVKWRKNNEC